MVDIISGARAIARRLPVSEVTVINWCNAGKFRWLGRNGDGKIQAPADKLTQLDKDLRAEERTGGQRYAG